MCNLKRFIGEATTDMLISGVDVRFVPKERVYPARGVRTVGFFGPDPAELRVAASGPLEGTKGWGGVFLHEYCHFLQWRAGTQLWEASMKGPDVADWLTGKKVRNIHASLLAEQKLELDCDIRAVALIHSRKLEIDAEDYTRRSNAYLYFLTVMEKERKWYKGPPYWQDELVRAMPKVFKKSYRRVSKKVYNLIVEHCL